MAMSLLCLHLFTGCSYYRIKSVPDQEITQKFSWLKQFNEAQKYIILHQGEVSMRLMDAKIDEANLELSGVPKQSYVNYPGLGKSARLSRSETQSPLKEVHLYLSNEVNMTTGQPLSIPMTSIQKIGYSDKDAGRSILNAAGIIVGTLALIVVIVALTKSSCPFVYVQNGEQWVFQGELYPGNIIANAQKTDYIRLPAIKEVDGLYSIEITNELLEIQHTDEAVLEVVDHPADVTIFMDPSGKLHSIKDPVSPVQAIADQEFDVSAAVLVSDSYYAAFDSPQTESDGTRNIELWFNKNQETNKGKLMLSLKNSYWLDYAMGTYFEQYGDYYPEFQKSQQEKTIEESYTWRSDQSLPVSVYVHSDDGWSLQHEIYALGPMHYRDIVVPLDLEKVNDTTLKVRLESGFMFWEIDKVAIDYSDNIEMKKVHLYPHTATDNYKQEVKDLLASRDQQYLVQKELGDWVQVQYQSPPLEDEARTVFLRNTGYYLYKRNYSGEPNFEALKQFNAPGYFTKYAEGQFNALISAIIDQKPELVDSDSRN